MIYDMVMEAVNPTPDASLIDTLMTCCKLDLHAFKDAFGICCKREEPVPVHPPVTAADPVQAVEALLDLTGGRPELNPADLRIQAAMEAADDVLEVVPEQSETQVEEAIYRQTQQTLGGCDEDIDDGLSLLEALAEEADPEVETPGDPEGNPEGNIGATEAFGVSKEAQAAVAKMNETTLIKEFIALMKARGKTGGDMSYLKQEMQESIKEDPDVKRKFVMIDGVAVCIEHDSEFGMDIVWDGGRGTKFLRTRGEREMRKILAKAMSKNA